jgi:hypothetical protein
MWNLYVTAKTTNARPSSLLGIDAEWVAYQFDSAVSFLGNTIESASMERKEVGMGQHKRLEQKYTMQQLLDPDFRLPREDGPGEDDPVKALKGLEGMGVKGFKVDE